MNGGSLSIKMSLTTSFPFSSIFFSRSLSLFPSLVLSLSLSFSLLCFLHIIMMKKSIVCIILCRLLWMWTGEGKKGKIARAIVAHRRRDVRGESRKKEKRDKRESFAIGRNSNSSFGFFFFSFFAFEKY